MAWHVRSALNAGMAVVTRHTATAGAVVVEARQPDARVMAGGSLEAGGLGGHRRGKGSSSRERGTWVPHQSPGQARTLLDKPAQVRNDCRDAGLGVLLIGAPNVEGSQLDSPAEPRWA